MTDDEVEALVLSAPCAELLGRRLVAHDEERGWIKFEFEGRPEFLNPAGRVQGGLLTAMLDDTMGPVVLLKSGGALYPSSIDMTVSFLAAARPGALMCEAEVGRLGKSVGFVQGQLTDGEGHVARATSSVMLVPADRVMTIAVVEPAGRTVAECRSRPRIRDVDWSSRSARRLLSTSSVGGGRDLRCAYDVEISNLEVRPDGLVCSEWGS